MDYLLDIWDLAWDVLFWVLDTLSFFVEDVVGFFRDWSNRKQKGEAVRAAICSACNMPTNLTSGGLCPACVLAIQVPKPVTTVNRSTCAVCGSRISGGVTCPGLCARSLHSQINCATCGTTIPSGAVCSLDCLKKYSPHVYIPMASASMGGCLDCGSSLAPTYHPGCTMQGRLTQYLPIPGPFGSPGLTAAQAAQAQKKPVPFSGMAGYSEAGTPDDWDLELGYIRGYRWFSIQIPESWAGIRHREVRTGYYDVNGKPDITDEGMKNLADNELPSLYGAYGGVWEDGVNTATCAKYSKGTISHEPPEVREACGCGYWAYFDENLLVSSVMQGWNSVKADTIGICVLGCVEGTGRVIVGEKGFRSQYAKIVGLTVGQAAIPELMWWKSTDYAQDRYDNSYTVMPGSDGTVMKDFVRNGKGTPYQVQCSDDEIYNRLAKIEDMLGRKYPSARIVSSEDTLRKMFPPDRSGA